MSKPQNGSRRRSTTGGRWNRFEPVSGLRGGWGGWRNGRDTPSSSTFCIQFLSGRSVPATASACLSQSLTLGGEVQLLFFLSVKAAAAAAAPSEETLPESLSLLPALSAARAPPGPWSAQIWRRSNGCSAQQRARLAAPAPPRPAGGPAPTRPPAGSRAALGCLRQGAPRISPLTLSPARPAWQGAESGSIALSARGLGWPTGYTSAGVSGGRRSVL